MVLSGRYGCAQSRPELQQQQTGSSGTTSSTCNATDSSLQVTNQLLAHIAYQLQQQSAEVQEIRRAAASCDKNLSAARRCLQQLLSLVAITTEACCRVASAAAEYLSIATSAQNISRLQLSINSGRIIMLLLLLLLCTCSSVSTVHKQCSRWLVPTYFWESWWLLPAQQTTEKRHRGAAGLLNSPYRWCIIHTSGWYALGGLMLLAWTCWAWTQRAASQQPAKAAAPNDPLLSLLLTASSVSNSSLPLLAAVLPAALYEGVLGVLAVAAVSGRWAVWVCLWELWLWCCFYNCSRLRPAPRGDQPVVGQQQHVVQHAQQQQQQQYSRYPIIYHSLSDQQVQPGCNGQLLATRQLAEQQGLLQLPAARMGCVHRFSVDSAQLQMMVTASQLLLPIAMSVAAVWR